ncbi:MAG: polysaccharide biosynthesis/export family protein [Planctomycetota bacterium]
MSEINRSLALSVVACVTTMVSSGLAEDATTSMPHPVRLGRPLPFTPIHMAGDSDLLAPLNLDPVPDDPEPNPAEVFGLLDPNGGVPSDSNVDSPATESTNPFAKANEFVQTQEERILRSERARLEARARFDARNRDRIPADLESIPAPQGDQLNGAPTIANDRSGDPSLRPLPSAPAMIPEIPSVVPPTPDDASSPSDLPTTPSRPISPELPESQIKPLPRPRPKRLSDAPPLPRLMPSSPRSTTPLPDLDDGPGESSGWQPPINEDASAEQVETSEQEGSSQSVLQGPAPMQGRLATPAPVVPYAGTIDGPLEPFGHWPAPPQHQHAFPYSNVPCSSCGGCVDRDGVGLCDEVQTYFGVGRRAKKKCQCWRCPQSPPFNLYGPGGYVGPARPAPIREYRLRGGDQIQLTFLIRSIQTDGAYRLVVGDQLLVESEADEKLTRGTLDSGLEVQPDGTITLRFIGEVHAAGRTIDQLREVLNERYKTYYPEPAIDVTPVRTGSVARQIREAISGSEGFNAQTTLQRVTPEGTIRLPRLGAVPAQGLTLAELKREINLRYNSIAAGLEVEPNLEEQAPHFVYVLGDVTEPGQFEMTAPTTVLGAIGLAGSYVPGANLRQVVIFRRGPNWELLSTLLDLRAAILGKQSNPPDEIWLQDGDVVIVPTAPIQLFDRFVTQVFTEGIYGIVPFGGVSFTFGEQN